MPPKRKLKPEPISTDSDDSELNDSGSPTAAGPWLRDDDVRVTANIYHSLPTDALLAQISGLASLLSARIAALKPSNVTGDVRLLKDCIRILNQALFVLTPTVMDFTALEVALLGQLHDATATLAQHTGAAQRRPRRH